MLLLNIKMELTFRQPLSINKSVTMKDLYEIIHEHNLSDKKINPLSKRRIVLRSNLLYSVTLIPAGNKKIHMIKDWRLGLLGKFLFKNKLNRYEAFLGTVKDCLERNHYEIVQLNYFPQSDI